MIHVLGDRKGSLKPISVIVKIRQGRKASTLVTNFEPYLLTSDFLAEELRRICASATSGKPIFKLEDTETELVRRTSSVACARQNVGDGGARAGKADPGCHRAVSV
jgi:Translation initiation factor SUI1